MFKFLKRRLRSTGLDRNPLLLANLIVQMAERVAPDFGRALTKASAISAEEVLPSITLELCALYLHLFDRDAFVELGGKQRASFMDALFDAVVRTLEERGSVNQEHFPNGFRRLCNECQEEYSAYKELLPRPGASLRDTLFWEFGKKLAFKYEGYNPVAVQLFALAATDGYIVLREAVKKGLP
jgi:hypothetical protein